MPGEGVFLTYNGKVAFSELLISWEVRAMRNKRFQFGDRRQNEDMPNIPFKDSNGATIKECRRKLPDRRIDNIRAEWINESAICWNLSRFIKPRLYGGVFYVSEKSLN